MKRTFKFVAIGTPGTPIPLFGTTTTAACGPVGTPEKSLQSIPVADSSWFQQGDWAIIDLANSTVSKRERLLVEAVPDGTHIKVQGMQYSHVSGVYVQLAIACVSVFVQVKTGNTSPLVIGTDPAMVKATGVKCFIFLYPNAAGQPVSVSDPQYGAVDGMKSDDYWFDGTTAEDALLPSMTVL